MITQKMPTILIAYPQAFGCYEKFERKIDVILSNVTNFRLSYMADYNDFITKHFSSDKRITDAVNVSNENYLSNITHAIIFNDGESFNNLIADAKTTGIKSRIIETNITKVVNIDKGGKHDIYIGRGSPWGNPYAIGFEGDERDDVIRKYKYDFDRGFLKSSKDDALKLKGKVLGCHCKPMACHGDVIAEYLNSLDDGK
jgi:hypothetical protein